MLIKNVMCFYLGLLRSYHALFKSCLVHFDDLEAFVICNGEVSVVF